MRSPARPRIAATLRKLGIQARGAVAGAAAALLFSSAAAAAPTYQLSTDNEYAWETSSNILTTSSFGRSCTLYPVDDDQAVINFTGGLTFNFAGTAYSSVRMLTNGRLQFGADTGAFRSYSRSALPEGSSPFFLGFGCVSLQPASRIMDVAWMDVHLSSGGTMSWEQKGTAPNRRVVLSWNSVAYNLGAGAATFQAILYESGAAAYQYKSLTGASSWTSIATTGIQVSPTDYTPSSAAANGVRIDFGSYVKFNYQPASSTGSTCAPMLYTVTAQDSSGATLASYKGTMELSVLTSGSFSLASGKGVFTPRNDVTGDPATYVFDPADKGVAKFNYSTSLAERAGVSFTDSIFEIPSAGPVVSFADNVFVIASGDPAGLDVVAGRPHAMSATLYAKDASGTCGVATSYSGTAQDMWHSPTALNPSGAAAPSISTSPTCSGSAALPSSAPAISKTSNNASLPFSRGIANFYLCAADVGQYSLSIPDDTGIFASNPLISSISGSSAPITARPFGLWIDAVSSRAVPAKANPAGTASSGSGFIAAGSPFTARVSARKWASGQDSLKGGTPDPGANLSGNAILTAFSAPTSISIASFTPAAGISGSLSGGSIAAAAYVGGAARASLSYSEAGSAALSATAPSYLGSAFGVPGPASGAVGRFFPAAISLVGSSLTHACSRGYSYMGQDFGLSATLSAYGAGGNQLLNYDQAAGYQYLLSPQWRAVDSANGVNLASRAILPSGSAAWRKGSWDYSTSSAVFTRSPSGPDGAYDSLIFGLAGSDSDGVGISGLDASSSIAGAPCGSSCDMKAVGVPTRARYGRLDAINAFGAVLPTLKVPLRAMYWARGASGSQGWAPNTLDSCTFIPYAAVAVGGYSGAVSSASTPAAPAAVVLAGGKGEIPVTRSGGAAVSGSVLLGINLGLGPSLSGGGCYGSPSVFPRFAAGALAPHLKSNFCAAPGYLGNPSAKIIWGAPAGKSGSVVFVRESY